MKVIYTRVSTENQNNERQLTSGLKTFPDSCSGSVPFMKRPFAIKLVKFLTENKDVTTSVKSVDRLGRNTLDILNVVQMFRDNQWELEIQDLGMNSKSPFFDLMISLMGTLAEHERKMINERAQQGREIAKAKGIYKGRLVGSKDSREKTLRKHIDVVTCLEGKMKITDIAKVTGKTRATIYKVKKML